MPKNTQISAIIQNAGVASNKMQYIDQLNIERIGLERSLLSEKDTNKIKNQIKCILNITESMMREIERAPHQVKFKLSTVSSVKENGLIQNEQMPIMIKKQAVRKAKEKKLFENNMQDFHTVAEIYCSIRHSTDEILLLKISKKELAEIKAEMKNDACKRAIFNPSTMIITMHSNGIGRE